MAGKIKLSIEMLKPLSGEGDVIDSKIKLVARLQDITDTTYLLPLCLEGDAFALYFKMMNKKSAMWI